LESGSVTFLFLCLPIALRYYVSSARKTHIKVPAFEVMDAAQALATTFACWFSTMKIWCHSVSPQLLTSPHQNVRNQDNSGFFLEFQLPDLQIAASGPAWQLIQQLCHCIGS